MFTAIAWKYSDKDYTGPEITIERSSFCEGAFLVVSSDGFLLNDSRMGFDGPPKRFDTPNDAMSAVEAYVKQWKLDKEKK